MPRLWVVLAFAAVGLAVAYAAVLALPCHFPSRRLVLATGPVAALLGGLLCLAVLGDRHVLLALAGCAGFAAALLSLLVRPAPEGSGSPRAA